MTDRQEIEMVVSKAASLYTILFVEQRRYSLDADYEGDRAFEVSALKDQVTVALGLNDNAPNGWTVVELSSDEWDEVETILDQYANDVPGHFDNDLQYQYALSSIAEQLLEFVEEYRDEHYE